MIDPRSSDEYRQLEQAIAALEVQRGVLGDAVVDSMIAAARERLAALTSMEPSTPDLHGERRQATILLADVKGSTALAERVDTETWVEIMNNVFHLLGDAVYYYGGEIDQYRGDGLVAFFGARAAHEDDPERAVRASLDMQDAVKRYAAELHDRQGVELLLRVGINTGEVIAAQVGDRTQHSEDTAMGRAIAVAARMESAAEPGTVLVTENTYRRVQPLFEWQPLGEITVKGVSQPVTVYRPLAAKPVVGKARGIAGLSSPLVGRDKEMTALRKAVDGVQRGVGGIVTLVGEAGLGKSRLVAELRALSNDGQTQWVEGRCLSYGGSIAYLLWLDMLRSILQVASDASPTVVGSALRAQVQALCPDCLDAVYPYLCKLLSLPLEDKYEALRSLQGESLRAEVFHAVQILIESAARQQPVVMVCEDLHWADATSLALLERVLALTDRAALLTICVFRPEVEHPCWQLKETVTRLYHHRHTDLWLDALSVEESQALVGHLLLVEDLPQALRVEILDHAEGNPFYVEEVLRTLIDDGTIVRDEKGYWRATREIADIPIPDTLHGVLSARIDRLQEETRRVLRLASVIGRVFLYRVLAEIGKEERQLDTRLLTLQRQQLIRERARLPESEYIFKHELTREAAYGGLLKRERRAYHRQVAEALERLFPEQVDERAGLLAYHWERAEEPAKAVEYLLRAGEQAAAQFANTEAVGYFSQALSLTGQGDLDRRYALLLARARVYDVQGAHEAQAQDLAALEELVEAMAVGGQPSARLQAKVVLQRARYANATGDYPSAIGAAQKAIALAQVGRALDLEAAGRRQWGRALVRQGDLDTAHSQLLQALDILHKTGNQRDEGSTLIDLGTIRFYQADYAEASAYFEQALSLCRETGERMAEGRALRSLGAISNVQDDYALASERYEQSLRICQEIGDRRGESVVLGNLGNVLYCQGLCSEAMAYYGQALRIYREIGNRRGEGWALNGLGDAFRFQGDYTRARTYCEQALAVCREIGDRTEEGSVLSSLALLLHQLGDNQAARDCGQRALQIAKELGEPHVQGYALNVLGHAFEELGCLEKAASAYRESLVLRREADQASLAMESLAGLARVHLAQSDPTRARSQVEQILDHLATKTLDGTEDRFPIYLTCYRTLCADRDPRATSILETAHRLLQELAGKISDAELQHSFLENVAANREIVHKWRQLSSEHSDPPQDARE